MYAQDSVAVRAGGAIFETFKCLQQRRLLSPLLFGLINDLLDRVVRNLKGSHASQLKSKDVPLLLFADGLVLRSTSEEGLKRLLHALQMV